MKPLIDHCVALEVKLNLNDETGWSTSNPVRRRHGGRLQLDHRHPSGRPQESAPDGPARAVPGNQVRVQAADEGGGIQGPLPRLASGHDEGISGQRVLLPRLRGCHETAEHLLPLGTTNDQKNYAKTSKIVLNKRILKVFQDGFMSESSKTKY